MHKAGVSPALWFWHGLLPQNRFMLLPELF